MSIPAIVINLDRSLDRLAHIKAEFARAGMAFERFSAVDGCELPAGVKPYFCDATGRLVSPLTAGEIGCYASHLAIWQRIAAGRYGQATLVCGTISSCRTTWMVCWRRSRGRFRRAGT
jgi:glycosyl transferase family 25